MSFTTDMTRAGQCLCKAATVLLPEELNMNKATHDRAGGLRHQSVWCLCTFSTLNVIVSLQFT